MGTHDLDHPEACGLVNVSSDSYPIRTVTISKYYFIIKLKLEKKIFNFLCITSSQGQCLKLIRLRSPADVMPIENNV